jgi:hypothetical protein
MCCVKRKILCIFVTGIRSVAYISTVSDDATTGLVCTVQLFIFSSSAAKRGIWPPRSRGFLITHNDAPQSVGFLWTSDQFVAETSTWKHKHTQQTNIHAPGGIRTHDSSRRAAVDQRLRPRGYWDQLVCTNTVQNYFPYVNMHINISIQISWYN